MISGIVLMDLRDAARDRMRSRVAGLPDVPDGARVLVVVGALAPEPTVARELAVHERRLHIDVFGTAFAVRGWIDAVRDAPVTCLEVL